MKIGNREIPNRFAFLTAVLACYFLIALFDSSYSLDAAKRAALNIRNLLPILLFVFVIMFIVNLLIKPETVKKHLGHDSGLKGWAFATIGAMIFVGPPYVVMPFLGELKRNGMKDSLIAVFLNNRSVQPVFMPVMAHYFGLTYTLIMFSLTFAFSFVNAMIVERIIKTSKSISP